MTESMSIYQAAHRALQFASARHFVGADPYDGLLSPAASILRGRRGRQVWVQTLKRSPAGVRSATGIEGVRMVKALALFAEGSQILGEEGEAQSLVSDILSAQQGGPWGYEFDVQTRWAYYKANTPNVIATAFAVRALDATGSIPMVSEQIIDWLYGLRDERGFFYYTEASGALIHNGNLLAAESILRLGGDRQQVEEALQLTLNAQAADGSWPYGEGERLAWVDNFHTVYILESLLCFRKYGFDVENALAKGSEYWTRSMFDGSGLPLYFARDRTPSHDIHNISSAVGALKTLRDTGFATLDPSRAIDYLLSHQGPDGGFRSNRFSPAFMRWNQGHAFLALSRWADVR